MVTRRTVILLLGVALVAVSLLVWRSVGHSDQARDSPEVIVVRPRTFSSTVVAVGAVKPRIGSEVRVGSRISGRVWKLRANIGDQVKQGQVIAELETAELDAVLAIKATPPRTRKDIVVRSRLDRRLVSSKVPVLTRSLAE